VKPERWMLLAIGTCPPMTMSLRRIERDAVIACIGMTVAALVVWPRTMAAAGGVLGGGVLIGLSYWAIRGVVDGMLAAGVEGRWRGRRVLVKFVTRHAILALAAYGMMARLRVDPVALLVGVTSLGVAAAAEAIRVLVGGQAQSDR
jgi:hypothetical protein